MLYDPKWEAPKPLNRDDYLTLDKLIAWLEKQDHNTRYNYGNAATCLVANYLKDCGIPKYSLAHEEIPECISYHIILPETYGAALRKLRRSKKWWYNLFRKFTR